MSVSSLSAWGGVTGCREFDLFAKLHNKPNQINDRTTICKSLGTPQLIQRIGGLVCFSFFASVLNLAPQTIYHSRSDLSFQLWLGYWQWMSSDRWNLFSKSFTMSPMGLWANRPIILIKGVMTRSMVDALLGSCSPFLKGEYSTLPVLHSPK